MSIEDEPVLGCQPVIASERGAAPKRLTGIATERTPAVLYDGECNLCNGAVEFIRRHDQTDRFRFVPLEAAEAEDLLETRDGGCDTLHLLDEAGHHDRSTAVLRIAANLTFPWSLFRFLKFVPQTLRDACYGFVARRRRRWFGRVPRRPQP